MQNKKYSDDLRFPGVYKIVNSTNGRLYIGATFTTMVMRISNHCSILRSGEHANKELQLDWNYFGEDVFSFGCIEKMENTDTLRDREKYYIDSLGKMNRLYNLYTYRLDAKTGKFIPGKSIGMRRLRNILIPQIYKSYCDENEINLSEVLINFIEDHAKKNGETFSTKEKA